MEKKKVDPINLKRIVKPKDAKKKIKGIDIEKISGKKKTDTKLILLALSKLLGINGEEKQKVRIPGRRAVYNKRDSRGRMLPTMPAIADREETRVIPRAELPTIVTPGIPPALYDNSRETMVNELVRLLGNPEVAEEADVQESPAARAVRLGIYDPHERRYRNVEGVDRLFRNGTGRMVDGGDIVSGLSNLLEQVGLELPELHMPGHSFTGPGTDLKRRLDKNDKPRPWSKPINRVDETALHHDLCYRDNPDRNACDKKMLVELNDIKNPTLRERAERTIVKGIIGTKSKLGLGFSGGMECKYIGNGECMCVERRGEGKTNVELKTVRYPKENIQSILINKCNRTLADAEKWISTRGFKNYKVDETKNYYRFRQHDPKKFKNFKTLDIGEQILVVVGDRK